MFEVSRISVSRKKKSLRLATWGNTTATLLQCCWPACFGTLFSHSFRKEVDDLVRTGKENFFETYKTHQDSIMRVVCILLSNGVTIPFGGKILLSC